MAISGSFVKFGDEEKREKFNKLKEKLQAQLLDILSSLVVLGQAKENPELYEKLSQELPENVINNPGLLIQNYVGLIMTMMLDLVKYIKENGGEIKNFSIQDSLLDLLSAEDPDEKLDNVGELLVSLSLVRKALMA